MRCYVHLFQQPGVAETTHAHRCANKIQRLLLEATGAPGTGISMGWDEAGAQVTRR